MVGRRLSYIASSTVLLSSFAGEALAQAIAPAPDNGLEEVVVSARKREENLLTVPISVTAFSSRKLEAEGIHDIQSVADFTPSFNVSNTGAEASAEGGSHADRATQNLLIRGIFNRASVFIDGAPVPDGIVSDVADLSRVEVVKGPQSAYFGRATFIGALNLVTKVPGDEFKGSVDALFGSYNWHDLSGSVEGPIVPGKLAARVSVRDYSMDGQYRNAGGPDAYLGAQSTKSLTVDVNATPIDNLTVNLYGLVWKDSDGPGPVGKYTAQDWNCNAGGAPAGTLNYYCGTLPSFNLARVGMNTVIDPLFQSVILNNSTKNLSPILPNFDDHGGLERRAYHLHANINYYFADLGVTATSLTAFNQDNSEDITDIDLANSANIPNPRYGIVPNVNPYINWLFYYQDVERSDSQEFRFASDQSDRFRWTVGANYTFSFSNYYVMQDSVFGGPLPNAPGNPNDSTTYGAFFSAGYDITPSLTISLEGRWQDDEIEQFERTPDVPLNGASTTSLAAKKNFYNLIPRAILQYKYDPDTMLYTSYSEGVSPGGFNTALIGASPLQLAALSSLVSSGGAGVEYRPEKLDNYELGIKGRLWDNRIQYSFDGYYATWTDQQVLQELNLPQVNALGQLTGGIAVTAVTTNIGKSVIDGIETEGSASITKNLVFSWSGALNASEIKKYDCENPCVAITGNPNVAGKQLPYYSKWSGTAGLEYNHDITEDVVGFGRVDYIYKSGMYDTYSNTAKTMATNRVNFRAGIKSGRYSLEAFILNAFNDTAPTSIERNVDVLSPAFTSDINVGLPLKTQIGIRGHYDF